MNLTLHILFSSVRPPYQLFFYKEQTAHTYRLSLYLVVPQGELASSYCHTSANLWIPRQRADPTRELPSKPPATTKPHPIAPSPPIMPQQKNSRPKPAPPGNEEATTQLNLGEFQNVDTLTLSEAALVLNALVAKRRNDRKDTNETPYVWTRRIYIKKKKRKRIPPWISRGHNSEKP